MFTGAGQCANMWHCFCRKLAHGSSVDDQGRDRDASFAVRGAEEEVHVHVATMYVHVHVCTVHWVTFMDLQLCILEVTDCTMSCSVVIIVHVGVHLYIVLYMHFTCTCTYMYACTCTLLLRKFQCVYICKT